MQVLRVSGKIEPDGHLRLDVPTPLSPGEIDLVLILNPTHTNNHTVSKYDFSDLVGKLTWKGNALSIQKQLRNEW